MGAAEPIIGVDATRGGGVAADFLPLPAGQSREMLLIEASENWAPGEGFRMGYFDVLGLDPRLVVAVSFQTSQNANILTSYPGSNILVDPMWACVLALTAQGWVEGAKLDSAALFVHGGSVGGVGPDAATVDGCELTTAVQGVRFVYIAQRTGNTNVDITATVQVRPSVALVCPDLAKALLLGVSVTRAKVARW